MQAVTPEEQKMLLGAGVFICPRSTTSGRLAGRASGAGRDRALHRGRFPSSIDDSLTDDDDRVVMKHVHPSTDTSEVSQWDEATAKRYGETCIDMLTRFAPNFRGAIDQYEVLAPPDLERIFGLQGGSIFQGETGMTRWPSCGRSRTLAQYATRSGASTSAVPAPTPAAASPPPA